jgi:hypothetical protein
MTDEILLGTFLSEIYFLRNLTILGLIFIILLEISLQFGEDLFLFYKIMFFQRDYNFYCEIFWLLRI